MQLSRRVNTNLVVVITSGADVRRVLTGHLDPEPVRREMERKEFPFLTTSKRHFLNRRWWHLGGKNGGWREPSEDWSLPSSATPVLTSCYHGNSAGLRLIALPCLFCIKTKTNTIKSKFKDIFIWYQRRVNRLLYISHWCAVILENVFFFFLINISWKHSVVALVWFRKESRRKSRKESTRARLYIQALLSL